MAIFSSHPVTLQAKRLVVYYLNNSSKQVLLFPFHRDGDRVSENVDNWLKAASKIGKAELNSLSRLGGPLVPTLHPVMGRVPWRQPMPPLVRWWRELSSAERHNNSQGKKKTTAKGACQGVAQLGPVAGSPDSKSSAPFGKQKMLYRCWASGPGRVALGQAMNQPSAVLMVYLLSPSLAYLSSPATCTPKHTLPCGWSEPSTMVTSTPSNPYRQPPERRIC